MPISVTRWLDYLLNIWPFTTLKNSSITKTFAKVGTNFCLILMNLKIIKYYIFCQSGEISPNLVTLNCQSMYAIIAAAKNVKVGITLLCQKLLLLLFQSKCTYAIRTVFYNEKPITQLKGHYKTWLKWSVNYNYKIISVEGNLVLGKARHFGIRPKLTFIFEKRVGLAQDRCKVYRWIKI